MIAGRGRSSRSGRRCNAAAARGDVTVSGTVMKLLTRPSSGGGGPARALRSRRPPTLPGTRSRPRVELRPGAAVELGERVADRAGAAVGPVAGHRVEGVRDREDARARAGSPRPRVRPGSRRRPSARGGGARTGARREGRRSRRRAGRRPAGAHGSARARTSSRAPGLSSTPCATASLPTSCSRAPSRSSSSSSPTIPSRRPTATASSVTRSAWPRAYGSRRSTARVSAATEPTCGRFHPAARSPPSARSR